MDGSAITAWFIVAVAVVAIAYDVWVCITHGSAATISWTTWKTSQQYPVIPFAIGVLCGHLFWVQQTGMLDPTKQTTTPAASQPHGVP